jgi:hypothetical protein
MTETRKLENFHILLWLLKDMSWLMTWRSLGIFMIIPTLGFAILITWRARNFKSELFHNLAVICWISANSFWMVTEFFGLGEQLKHFAIIPFAIGLILIVTYHVKKFLQDSAKKNNGKILRNSH